MSLNFRTILAGLLAGGCLLSAAGAVSAEDPTKLALERISKMEVGKKDWPQWGGSYGRNNTPEGKNIPLKWNVETGENVLWSMPLGSETYGNPVVANGKVYIGTNNGNEIGRAHV